MRNMETDTSSGSPAYFDLLFQLAEIHSTKSADYGIRDLEDVGYADDPLANYRTSPDWGTPAWIGALIRADDKRRRLITYAMRGELANESVMDAFLDYASHILIACVLWQEDIDDFEIEATLDDLDD